jgi:hypothetical protein
MNQAEWFAKEEIIYFLRRVLLEETIQNAIVEMLTSGLKALATHRLLSIRLISFVVEQFDTSVLGNVRGFIEITVSFEETLSPTSHGCVGYCQEVLNTGVTLKGHRVPQISKAFRWEERETESRGESNSKREKIVADETLLPDGGDQIIGEV